jgi:hypothetical protein
MGSSSPLRACMRFSAATSTIAFVACFLGCWDFTYAENERARDLATEPAEVGDGGTSTRAEKTLDATPPSLDGGAAPLPTGDCNPSGLYCGGHGVDGPTDVLHRCTSGTTGTLVAKCANGCIVRGTGGSDECNAPAPCFAGGLYCGGDKVNGDPAVLYKCVDAGAPEMIKRCQDGCEVRPGKDDACKEWN